MKEISFEEQEDMMIEDFVQLVKNQFPVEQHHRETVGFLKEWAHDLESPHWVDDHRRFVKKIRARIQELNREAGL